MRLEISDPAEREISEAYDWYSERSPQAAGRFLAELDRAFDVVLKSPRVWPKLDSDTRRFVLKRYPFSLIYHLSEDAIQIIALAHHKRLPGYWTSR